MAAQLSVNKFNLKAINGEEPSDYDRKAMEEKKFAVVEPNDDECAVEGVHRLTKIVTQFQERLRERASYYIGKSEIIILIIARK